MSYDFANILFAGPCNRACPWCVGRALPAPLNEPNLALYPPRNLDALLEAINAARVRDVVLTGTNSDPQLYRHERRLLALLRRRLHAGARLALHTNGARVLRRLTAFNSYDRACISFPSFDPGRYRRLMGSAQVPDLAAILAAATIPVKVSALVNADNEDDLGCFLARCRAIGVRRVVLRRLLGDARPFAPVAGLQTVGSFKGNPVCDYEGMQVTLWRFDHTRELRSLNLFADGTLTDHYLLRDAPLRSPAVRHA
ncbi:MAG: radical SAM protein [Proteobacteria bacterium]|nr:radical SAM protein [Pseudomonadota bacterium]